MAKIIIDPVTRIEGHLRIDTEVRGSKITDAWSRGEMFRGFEAILTGRDPFDAPVITQRICGVCPVSHAIASCKALESAFQIRVPQNALMMRNIVLAANFLASHLTHFYQLSALDFIQVESLLSYQGNNRTLNDLKGWAKQELASNKILPVSPFLPHLQGDYPDNQQWNFQALEHYVLSLEARKNAHKMAALFGGKMPHTASLLAGGVTTSVTADVVENVRSRLRTLREFIDHVYLPDVVRAAELFPEYAHIGAGVGVYLAYGVFDEGGAQFLPGGFLSGGKLQPLDVGKITEEASHSYYREHGLLHPTKGKTEPVPHKEGAYSWIKSPRYGGESCEVGPLARLLIARESGVSLVEEKLYGLLHRLGWRQSQLNSVMGRHAARALEASMVAERMEYWLDSLQQGAATVGELTEVQKGAGEGLVEAPRGALGHWVSILDGKIANYQCIVPSTWNFSPKDGRGTHGPVETALINTPVAPKSQGLEAARVVRSFDPCIACAIH